MMIHTFGMIIATTALLTLTACGGKKKNTDINDLITSVEENTSNYQDEDAWEDDNPWFNQTNHEVKMRKFKLVSKCEDNTEKALYGDDNRLNHCETSSEESRNWGKATAMLVKREQLSHVGDVDGEKVYKISGQKLSSRTGDYSFCPEVKFQDEISSGFCTAFLYDNDKMMTAGHCFKGSYSFQIRIVFTVRADGMKIVDPESLNDEILVSESQIYEIDDYNRSFLYDVATIKLKREKKDVNPFTIDMFNNSEVGNRIRIVGHPVGLPMKYSDGKVVSKAGFKIYGQMASFGGNSGSPVVNLETGEVAGVLVEGQKDFELDYARMCVMASKYELGSDKSEKFVSPMYLNITQF
jgi:V8-like Glu-specific endopeptidase